MSVGQPNIILTNCEGRVDNPKPLTEYDPTHPYMVAVYDGKAG